MTPATPKALVNIAHTGKVKRRRIAHSPHNAFRSSGTSPNFLISLCEEFNLRFGTLNYTACCRCARMTVVVTQSSLGVSDEQT
jgi:hypothetical protein